MAITNGTDSGSLSRQIMVVVNLW